MRALLFALILSGLSRSGFLSAEEAGAVKAAGTAPADGAAAPAAGNAQDYFKDMVLVPRGEFLMGSDEKYPPSERPRHKVFLDAYYIDKYEVTAARYRLFAKAAGKTMPRQSFPDKDNYPAVYMNWQDAMAYCERQGKRLPTEAQWEKAAGGGAGGKFCSGDNEAGLGEYAWFWNNSGKKIHPVGLKKPNGYGIYDMHGNVLEWTADWYAEAYYAVSPAANPQGPAGGKEKVIRGGSVFVSADLCRSAARMKSSPETRYSVKGFRCAASVPR
ncbi:MAG: SUMF1/EgtB/PvdO family nonheme iron enzyme [Elusimicrobia bacterium]|nr:SUMF1/EgtB/PvdO family nonheme iron enzyme [Elusimicrobiota bacterium]